MAQKDSTKIVLAELAKGKLSLPEIAAKLGRPYTSVHQIWQIHKKNLPKPPSKRGRKPKPKKPSAKAHKLLSPEAIKQQQLENAHQKVLRILTGLLLRLDQKSIDISS